MIRRLKSGQYRLYARKRDPKTHKRRNLGTFESRELAEKHEREVQYFKRHSGRHKVIPAAMFLFCSIATDSLILPL